MVPLSSPWLGVILECACALSAWIMASASLKVTVMINVEVKIMIKAIGTMCLAAGTALLGRSGDMFPKPGEKACTIKKSTFETWERAQGGSIPPSPRHIEAVFVNRWSNQSLQPMPLVRAAELFRFTDWSPGDDSD